MGKRTADANEVSKRLRKLRLEKGIRSQSELSELAGVSYISIGRYERAETVPEGENLLKLASFYNVYPEYILGKTECKNALDKWNQAVDLEQLREEVMFWETGTKIGLFPELRCDDETQSFIQYLKQYEERSEMKVKIDDIKVVTNANTNEIRENFETGEITIYAISEADAEKGFRQLIKRGMIEE